MSLTCRANRHPLPSGSLSTGAWLRATFEQIMSYEACGKVATHLAYGGRQPLCREHAEEMRAALRSAHTLGNLIAGRPRTEEEIVTMVRPIPDVN